VLEVPEWEQAQGMAYFMERAYCTRGLAAEDQDPRP